LPFFWGGGGGVGSGSSLLDCHLEVFFFTSFPNANLDILAFDFNPKTLP